jgi:hypothetical protein
MSAAYSTWWWPQFLKALDRAGYAVVKKPELLEKGRPTIGGQER